MEISKIEKESLKEALDLVWNVFYEFEAPDYPQEGIEEFRNFINYSSILQRIKEENMLFWGAFEDGNLVGVIATRNIRHISLLFVDKKYHHLGIATSLFKTIYNYCNESKGISKITVNSSPYATGFYHKIGFIDNDTEQCINGIRFTPMYYKLKKRHLS